MPAATPVRWPALVLCLGATTVLAPVSQAEDDAPVPIYAANDPGVQVQWMRRIWCAGPHNAFPDLAFFRDRWYVAVREGTAHGVSGFGRVRVVRSKDGRQWEPVALFDGFGDYRRGELSVTPDGRLMLVAKFNHYARADGTAGEKKPFTARDHAGEDHEVRVRGYENRVAFSADGRDWSKAKPVRGSHPRAWFYSGVQWHDGVGYAIDRQGRTLYRTGNGVVFEPVSEVPVGNESRIGFRPDGTMVVFFRNGSLATSPAPYAEWTLNAKNRKGPHSYGGPGILVLPEGDVWTASRHRIDPDEFAFPRGENRFPDGTVLFRLEDDVLVPKLLIRGGGDRGYNGLQWRDGHLWMVWNAPSREAGRSCIYFAKVALE